MQDEINEFVTKQDIYKYQVQKPNLEKWRERKSGKADPSGKASLRNGERHSTNEEWHKQ